MKLIESIVPFMKQWLEEREVRMEDRLFIVTWNYPGRDGIANDEDFQEVVIVSKDKGKAAIAYVELDNSTISQRNAERLEVEERTVNVHFDTLEFEDISGEQLADRLVRAIFLSNYSFSGKSMEEFSV